MDFNASTAPIAEITYELPQNQTGRPIDYIPNPVITVTYTDGKKNVFDTNTIFNRGYVLGLSDAGPRVEKPKPFDVYDQPGYREMLEAEEVEILAWETFGSYQGDYAIVLKRNDMLGFLVIGYGSCSGCDALESCSTQEAYDSLMLSVLSSISWGGPQFIREKITNLFEDNNWYRHDAGFVDSIANLLKAIK